MIPPLFDDQTASSLLVEATAKLIELRKDSEWARQTPPRCPPILWFGNALSTKPCILTVGANPSRQEYLSDTAGAATAKMDRSNDHRSLGYLEPPYNRFRLLTLKESLGDVVQDANVRAQILTGYNKYFARNPYRWFGLPNAPYNVEAFLRGMGASYYDGQPQPLQALHIDLFPFATLNDFKTLQHKAEADLFRSGWAQQMIAALMKLFKPSVLIVFGRTNVQHFAAYVDPTIGRFDWNSFECGSYCVGETTKLGAKFVGLSTNLGNPIGFNKVSLGQFGARVARDVGVALAMA